MNNDIFQSLKVRTTFDFHQITLSNAKQSDLEHQPKTASNNLVSIVPNLAGHLKVWVQGSV
jgi:hypothetical protein